MVARRPGAATLRQTRQNRNRVEMKVGTLQRLTKGVEITQTTTEERITGDMPSAIMNVRGKETRRK